MKNLDESKKNPWVTLKSEVKFETPWLTVIKHDVLNPAGNPGLYGVINFKSLAIGVLPLDEDKNTWLVGQWRYPLAHYSWEIPEGGGDYDVEPVISAQRELKEETGLLAEKYTELCRMHTSNSATNELAIIFIARQLTVSSAEPEETEEIEIRKLPFDEAYKMVMNGEITDSLSMVAILKTKILIDQGEI